MEIVILIFQSILILGQFLLSRKINNQRISMNKGYFLIKKTNWIAPKEQLERFTDKFDISKKIPFYVVGNDDIIILGMEILVDGKAIEQTPIPSEGYFTRDERFGTMLIDIPFKTSHYEKDKIDIEVNMRLKNTCGYFYREKIKMRFNQENEKMWWLSKFNISFS